MVQCLNKKCEWIYMSTRGYCSQGYDPEQCKGNEDKVLKALKKTDYMISHIETYVVDGPLKDSLLKDLNEIKKDLEDSKK